MRLDSRRTPSRRAIAYTTNAELAKATAAAAWLKWYTTVTFLISHNGDVRIGPTYEMVEPTGIWLPWTILNGPCKTEREIAA